MPISVHITCVLLNLHVGMREDNVLACGNRFMPSVFDLMRSICY